MKTFIATAALLTIACSAPGILQAPQGPGTAYPCGVLGHVCDDQMCCGSDETCGGDDYTCPKLQCCFIGDENDHDNLGAKRVKMHPQTPMLTDAPAQ